MFTHSNFPSATRLKKRNDSLIRLAPIFVLGLSSFFVRGSIMPGGFHLPNNATSSVISVSAALTILLSLLFRWLRKRKIPTRPGIFGFYYLFVFFVLISFSVNFIFNPTLLKPILRFTFELLFSVSLPLLVYLYLRNFSMISFFYKGLMVMGGAMSLYFLVTVVPTTQTIRRLTHQSSDMIGANHFGHSLAIAAMIALIAYSFEKQRKNRIFYLTCLAFILPTLVLVGSRSALIGLTLSSIIFLLYSVRKTVKLSKVIGQLVIITFVSLFTALLLYLIGSEKIGSNLQRYTLAFLVYSLENKFSTFSDSIRGSLYLSEIPFLLAGGGMHKYMPVAKMYGSADSNYHPHNIFIGMLIFVGLPATLLLAIKILTLFRRLGRLITVVCDDTDLNSKFIVNATFCSLLIATLYSSVAGNLTRILTIWILMGIAERVIDTYGGGRRVKSVADG